MPVVVEEPRKEPIVSTSIWENATVETVDPRLLLLDRNPRTIADIAVEEPKLVASVRKHGVVLPVIANPVEGGKYSVWDGQCRVLAAILAVDKHPTIPVLVTEITDEDQLAQLCRQWIVNEIREGMSIGDKARALEQMSLFGLSEEEIATQLSTDVDVVRAGLAVRRSAKANTALERYPQLDMLQVSAFAEFEEDPDAVEELEAVLDDDPEQFDHAVAQLQLAKARKAVRMAMTEELRAAGQKVIDDEDNADAVPLRQLRRSATDLTPLTAENHSDCPGHAAVVTSNYHGEPVVNYACQGWKDHGHIGTSSYSSGRGANKGPRTQVQKAEMRRVRDNNEDWRAALGVRRTWLEGLLARKTPPKQATLQVLFALTEGGRQLTDALGRGSVYATKLLGLPDKKAYADPHPIAKKAKRANSNEVQMMLLALVLGAWESTYDKKDSVDTWRRPQAEDKLYFAALAGWGYPLSKVERLVLDPTADADQWPHLAESTDSAAPAAPGDTRSTNSVAMDSSDKELADRFAEDFDNDLADVDSTDDSIAAHAHDHDDDRLAAQVDEDLTSAA